MKTSDNSVRTRKPPRIDAPGDGTGETENPTGEDSLGDVDTSGAGNASRGPNRAGHERISRGGDNHRSNTSAADGNSTSFKRFLERVRNGTVDAETDYRFVLSRCMANLDTHIAANYHTHL